MLYLLTVDTASLPPPRPPVMMKELVSSSDMAQAELEETLHCWSHCKLACKFLLWVAVEGVQQAGDGAVTPGLTTDTLPGPPQRHRAVQDPGLVCRPPPGQPVRLTPLPLGAQHDAGVEAGVLAQAPAAAACQVGLDNVTSPDPRHGGEAALPTHCPGLHHHQLHGGCEAVWAVITPGYYQTFMEDIMGDG